MGCFSMGLRMLQLLVPALVSSVTMAQEMRMGLLGSHDPEAWSSDTNCSDSDLNFINCNLNVYEAAITTASAQQLDVVVFPEGYALARLTKNSFFEDLVSDRPGRDVCTTEFESSPQQHKLSCLAKEHGIMVVANIFCQVTNGTKYITQVVYDDKGASVVYYHKHHLFPSEALVGVKPGPFNPTTFSLNGHTFGIIICYEGFYPSLPPFDYSQMDALVAAGADAFVWSIGGCMPVGTLSKSYATKYKINIIATQDVNGCPFDSTGVFLKTDGTAYEYTDTSLRVTGYTANARLRSTTVF